MGKSALRRSMSVTDHHSQKRDSISARGGKKKWCCNDRHAPRCRRRRKGAVGRIRNRTGDEARFGR
jgi:hypothetical protein